MIVYSEFHYYWVIFEFINGVFISVLSGLDIYILFKRRFDKAPLVGWALNAKNSKNDFSLIVLSAFFFVILFVVYAYGSFSSNLLAKEIAELIGTVTYLMVSYVVFSWSKVFMRFI